MVDLDDLQKAVARSHGLHFGDTDLRERLRDLQHQVAELAHARDATVRVKEIGDVGWALLQLANEECVDFGECVQNTLSTLTAREPGRKVAIIGTSANPITNGHITMGLEILALTDCEEVWYLLVGEHPWGKSLLPAEHRLEMARLATAPYPKLKVSDFEIEHGERIYAQTRQTSGVLNGFLLPAFPRYSFSWVMGSDVAQTFHKWDGHDGMAEHIRMIVIHRQGYEFEKAGSVLAADRHLYLREDIVTSNISSTLVRNRGKDYDGSKLLALVPKVVWDYLQDNRLFDDGMMVAP